MLVLENASLVHTQSHDRTDVFRLCDDLRQYEWFFNVIHPRRVGHFRRSVDKLNRSVSHQCAELDRRHGCDYRHAKLAFESLLDDFHVKHAEEPATEPKSECCRSLRFPNKRRVVELKFLHRSAQFFKLRRVDRINTREDHGLHVLKTFDGLTRTINVRDGISDLHFTCDLDSGDQITNITCADLINRL